MAKLAVIGAGPSGLTSAVAALKNGLIPTVFEMSHKIGGVWGPDDRDISDQSAAWPGMKVNISRHTGTFSDVPWPPEAPDFPTTHEVYSYLCTYAEHHKIIPFIKFGAQIVRVFPKKNLWVVQWEEKKGVLQEEVFDSVIVATNKFTNPYIPECPGLDKIKGKMLHSSKYRSADAFANKKILVVGGSLSGTAIAEEVAKKAFVTHLLRKERWIIQRYRSSDPLNKGPFLPRDLLKTYASAQKILSREEQYHFMMRHCAEQNEFPEWRMSPDSPSGFVVADEYIHWLRLGKIKPIRGDIKCFTKSKVILHNEKHLNFDFVIFCTGYQRKLDFLPEPLRATTPLYEDTFPLGTQGIAFVGMYPGTRGAVFPLVELQASLACKVFSDQYRLPSVEVMLEEMAKTPAHRDEIQFSTAIAKKLGILPNLDSLNPGLRHMLLNGAYTPARFRLTGSHSNPAMAIKMIEETECYRRQLLDSKEKIPSLASLCIFQFQKPQKSPTYIAKVPNFQK